MNYKDFLLRFFAVVGLVLPFIIGLAVWGVWHKNMAAYKPSKPLPEEIILTLDLREPLVEQTGNFRLSLPSLPSLLDKSNGQPIFPLILALKRAKDDPRIKAVVAHLGPYTPSLVHAQELAAVLRELRKAKKETYIFAPSYGSFGPGRTSYFLASQFKNIWLQPVGAVGLTGIGMEAPFGKSALKQWGIETDFMRREEYKSVMENFSRDNFSPTVKKNMADMINNLSSQVADGIASGRGLKKEQVLKWMAEGPYTAKEALKHKMISKIGYKDEMMKIIKEKASEKSEHISAHEYLYRVNEEKDETPKASVAIIYAEGMIAETDAPSGMGDDQIIDTQEIVQAFKTASKDKKIKAILFRVNSPGGSPVASESMRRALVLAKEAKKPVFVSMGRVAASGGYWIAMNGTRIIADPATITGSIGVVAGKPVLGGLFDKLGVKWDSYMTSENAGMWSPRSKFSDKQRERMNAMLDDTYQTFISNVAEARKIPLEKMSKIAKGRVFTGEQALKVGLVDELGGLDVAVTAIKKELKLADTDKIALIPLPRPKTPRTVAIEMLKEFFRGHSMVSEMYGYFTNLKSKLGVASHLFNQGATTRLPDYVVR